MSPWCTEESASSMSELPLSSRPASSSEQKQTYLRNLEERIAEESDILEDIHLEAAIDAQLIFPSEEGAKSKHRPNTDNRPLFDDYENPNAVSNCLSPYVPSKATSIAAFLELVGSLKGGSDASDAPLHAEDVLLDIGCGDGRVCIGVSKLTRCRSIGIDVSPVCIERAKVIAAEEGVDDLCTFLQADATIAVDRLMEDTTSDLAVALRQTTIVFLYTYPTLLEKLIPLLRHLSQSENVRAVVTQTYHLPDHVAEVETEDEANGLRLYQRLRPNVA